MAKSARRIEQICASKFRGATQETSVVFDTSKPFVLIFGENGTGKSTLVDAIDFVCNQQPGSIEDISGATIAKHLPSIGCNSSDVSASVSVGGRTYNAGLQKSRVCADSKEGLPAVAILRRSKILNVVTAVPSKRFEALKRFVDVEQVRKSEDSLAKAIRTAKSKIDRCVEELAKSTAALDEAYRDNHTPEEKDLSSEEWGKQLASKDISTLEERLARLKAVKELNEQAKLLLEKKNDHQRDLNESRAKKEAVIEKISALGEEEAGPGVTLIELLEKAWEYIAKARSIEACPLCEKPNDAVTLNAVVDKKLTHMKELADLARNLAVVKEKVAKKGEIVANVYTDFVARCRQLVQKVSDLPPDLLDGDFFGPGTYPNLRQFDGELTKENIREANDFMAKDGDTVKKVEQELPALDRRVSQHKLLCKEYRKLIESREEAEKQTKILGILEQMYETVKKERLRFVQEVLDAVADECDRLYGQIHKNESIGQVRFAVDQEKRASLDMKGSFQGYDEVPPQAYFSESHLDTLGFCFFLALTKHTTNGEAIIVLDDVFTAVDLEHIERLLTLLLHESEKYYQVIFTTHQRRWLQFFESNRAPREKADLVALSAWTLDDGVKSYQPTTTLEDLKGYLAQGPAKRREIGSTAAFLIESVLEEMTKVLECRMARNMRNKYTCGPLLDAMRKPSERIEIHSIDKTDGTEQALRTPTLSEIIVGLSDLLCDVRNTVGDHFNWSASDITDKQVLDFGNQAVSLAERLICGTCGGMATRAKKDGFLYCPCNTLRLANRR